MKLDIVAWPIVNALVDEIRATFKKDEIDIDRVIAQWAENPILDVGEDGCALEQAWVRLVSQSPSLQFPAPQASPVWGGRSNPAAPGRMTTTLEVGVVHCTGWQVDDQFVPTEDEYMADTERCFAEMSALRRAICRTMVAQKREYQFVSFSPLNDGLSSGGVWQVQVDWIQGER